MEGSELLLITAYVSLFLELWVFPISSCHQKRHPLKKHLPKAGSEVEYYIFGGLACLGLFIVPIGLLAFPEWSLYVLRWDSNLTLSLTGVLLILMGRFISLYGLMTLRPVNSLWFSKAVPNQLVVNGAFRASRNPVLVGMHLFFLGVSLVFFSPWVWFGYLIFAVSSHRKVLRDEFRLVQEYGKPYLEYMRVTPRYV